MRSLSSLLVLGLLVVPGTARSADSKWTLSGQAGISTGDQTEPSFAWRAGLTHWHTPGAGIGVQFGRLRWEARNNAVIDAYSNGGVPFEGLEQGGHELYDLSGELRFRSSEGNGRGAFIAIGAGSYWQNLRDWSEGPYYAVPANLYFPMPSSEGDGDAHLGWHVAVGGMGIQGIAPGAEFRFDWIDSSPGPSAYFTASAALHLSR